jgi:hypothetical protein
LSLRFIARPQINSIPALIHSTEALTQGLRSRCHQARGSQFWLRTVIHAPKASAGTSRLRPPRAGHSCLPFPSKNLARLYSNCPSVRRKFPRLLLPSRRGSKNMAFTDKEFRDRAARDVAVPGTRIIRKSLAVLVPPALAEASG